MVTIADVLQAKQIEKILGRPLNEQEISGEEFEVRLQDGRYQMFAVSRIAFPYDLLPDYALNMSGEPEDMESEGYRFVNWDSEGRDTDETHEDL